MMPYVPWKVLVTVGALTVVASVSLGVGFIEGALVAIGALAGYLGRVNGAQRAPE